MPMYEKHDYSLLLGETGKGSGQARLEPLGVAHFGFGKDQVATPRALPAPVEARPVEEPGGVVHCSDPAPVLPAVGEGLRCGLTTEVGPEPGGEGLSEGALVVGDEFGEAILCCPV